MKPLVPPVPPLCLTLYAAQRGPPGQVLLFVPQLNQRSSFLPSQLQIVASPAFILSTSLCLYPLRLSPSTCSVHSLPSLSSPRLSSQQSCWVYHHLNCAGIVSPKQDYEEPSFAFLRYFWVTEAIGCTKNCERAS
jgi:hypothetical protein